MAIDETLVDLWEPVVRRIRPAREIDQERRVDRAIDASGNPVLENLPFLSVRSPDGSVWRIKVSNSGVITTAKEG
jgi:hypothetical protein